MEQYVAINEADDVNAIADPMIGSNFKISLPYLLDVTIGVEKNIHTSPA